MKNEDAGLRLLDLLAGWMNFIAKADDAKDNGAYIDAVHDLYQAAGQDFLSDELDDSGNAKSAATDASVEDFVRVRLLPLLLKGPTT